MREAVDLYIPRYRSMREAVWHEGSRHFLSVCINIFSWLKSRLAQPVRKPVNDININLPRPLPSYPSSPISGITGPAPVLTALRAISSVLVSMETLHCPSVGTRLWIQKLRLTTVSHDWRLCPMIDDCDPWLTSLWWDTTQSMSLCVARLASYDCVAWLTSLWRDTTQSTSLSELYVRLAPDWRVFDGTPHSPYLSLCFTL